MKKPFHLLLLSAVTMLILIGCRASSSDTTEYTSHEPEESPGFHTITVNSNISFDYHLYTPKTEDSVPLVITFHGYGEDVILPGTRILDTLTSAESQAVRPCYVMAPAIDDSIYLSQSNRDALYDALIGAADELIAAGNVDPGRIYAMGNSFGGLGTVEFVERFPDRVAAAVVMCPALTYDKRSTQDLGKIKDVPLWFAQATNDNVIPIETGRSAVRTLEALGASEVHLTEFTDDEMLAAGALVGYHQADFAVMADESFAKWLFSKTR